MHTRFYDGALRIAPWSRPRTTCFAIYIGQQAPTITSDWRLVAGIIRRVTLNAGIMWAQHYYNFKLTYRVWWDLRAQQTRDYEPVLFYCWSTVCDAGPTLKQHWLNISCLLVWNMWLEDWICGKKMMFLYMEPTVRLVVENRKNDWIIKEKFKWITSSFVANHSIILTLLHPIKHEALARCWADVGPAS